MNPVHDVLLRSKLPWDVCRIIKSFVGPRVHLPIEPDYTMMLVMIPSIALSNVYILRRPTNGTKHARVSWHGTR